MSTYSESFTCIYCGNKSASYSYDSRGKSRGETYFCLVCGWSKHEQDETCGDDCEENYENKPKDHTIKLAKKLIPFLEDLYSNNDYELVEDFFMSGWIGHFSDIKRYDAIIDILFSGPKASRKYL